MQSSPGRALCGEFGGDADLEGGYAWLTDADGRRHEVQYPEGWEVRLEPEPVLLGPTGEAYARPGDRICVWGSPVDADPASRLARSVFDAVSVDRHVRRKEG